MRRVLLLVTVGVVTLMLLANGCGGDDATDSVAVTTPPPVEVTTTVPTPSVMVSPLEQSAGGSVTLVVSQAVPSETLVFTITYPGGHTFVGRTHTVDDTGMVSAEFNTTGDPAGSYSVVANGSLGTVAATTFTVLPAPVAVTRSPVVAAASNVASNVATTRATATTRPATASVRPASTAG